MATKDYKQLENKPKIGKSQAEKAKDHWLILPYNLQELLFVPLFTKEQLLCDQNFQCAKTHTTTLFRCIRGADYLREFYYPMQMHFIGDWRVFHYLLKVPK